MLQKICRKRKDQIKLEFTKVYPYLETLNSSNTIHKGNWAVLHHVYRKRYNYSPQNQNKITSSNNSSVQDIFDLCFEITGLHTLDWFSKTSWFLIYLITLCSKDFLQQLTYSQLVKEFPALYGTGIFITAFTYVRTLSLSCATPIRSTIPH